jgi:hemin uptake protein HemP
MIGFFLKLSSIFSTRGLKMGPSEESGCIGGHSEPVFRPPDPGPPGARSSPSGSDAGLPAGPIEISSEALLAGQTEVRIRHRGELYRLTLTRSGKLILHK